MGDLADHFFPRITPLTNQSPTQAAAEGTAELLTMHALRSLALRRVCESPQPAAAILTQ